MEDVRMFCPLCGDKQSDELKYCKQCGANLYAVRQAVTTRQSPQKFDWSKTWVADMFLSESERKWREEELERERGITPEIKRYREIKAGVMTSSVGIGVTVFLYIFFQGLVAAGIPDNAAAIVSHLWVAGAIPFFVGLGLIVNGVVVSKRLIEAHRRDMPTENAPGRLESTAGGLGTGEDWPGSPPRFGVTENTTRQLRKSDQGQ
jgi:hypothetical protein